MVLSRCIALSSSKSVLSQLRLQKKSLLSISQTHLKNLTSTNFSRTLHSTRPVLDIFTVQDEDDFKTKVVNSSKPVIVEFHAPWCGPCKQLMPRMEAAVGGLKNEPVDLAKVDIDELPDIAMEYGVGAVPSVLAMKGGKVVDKFVGLQDDDKIQTFISRLTGS